MILHISISIILFVFLSTIDATLFDDASRIIIDNYCPFSGLTIPFCQSNTSSQSLFNGFEPFPIYLGIGYNPTLGQTTLPFFQTTYKLNKTFTSASGKTFAIPDQYLIQEFDSPQSITSSKIYSTLGEFMNGVSVNQNQSSVSGGLFGFNPLEENCYQEYFGDFNQKFMVATETTSIMFISFDPSVELIILPQWMEAFASLPLEYNYTNYEPVLNYIGPALVMSGNVGGLCQQTSTLISCFGGIGFIPSDNAELSLLKNIYPASYQNQNFYQGFTEYSKFDTVNIYGGDPTLFQASQWTQRIQTLGDYPVFVDVTLKSITDFITNSTIRSNLLQAIQEYYSTVMSDRQSVLDGWNQDWYSPKKVLAVPYLKSDEFVDGDYNFKPWYYGGPAASLLNFELGVGESNNVFDCQYSDDLQFGNVSCSKFMFQYEYSLIADFIIAFFTCNRDNDGLLYAYHNPAHFSLFPSKNQVINSTGAHVQTGCSYTSLHKYFEGNENYSAYSFYISLGCCTGCEATLTQVDIHKVDYFSCDCPSF